MGSSRADLAKWLSEISAEELRSHLKRAMRARPDIKNETVANITAQWETGGNLTGPQRKTLEKHALFLATAKRDVPVKTWQEQKPGRV